LNNETDNKQLDTVWDPLPSVYHASQELVCADFTEPQLAALVVLLGLRRDLNCPIFPNRWKITARSS
jgi:hypothetical protein